MVYKIPGVYSTIDASAAVRSLSPNEAVIGIVATATSGDDNVAYAPSSYEDAITVYGADSEIVKIMNYAIKNGGNRFIVVKVDNTTTPGTPDYTAALAILEMEEAVDYVLIDSTDATDHALVKTHCDNASDDRKERVSYVGLAAATDIASAKTAIETINSGNIHVAYPNPLDSAGAELSGIYLAAALAGADAAETDPSMPLTGIELEGFYGLAKKLKTTEMESLIDSGIIPLETNNGAISVVRWITSYTKDGEDVADITWQERTTTKISHYIMKDLRKNLRSKFKRAKQNEKNRGKVKTEVVNRLKTYESLEYIEDVQDSDVTISINATVPTQNDVVFEYDVVTPMNVITLTGHLVL